MIQRYPTVRKLAPQSLSTLVFRGHAVAANVLQALSVIADLYRTGKRATPDKARHAKVVMGIQHFGAREIGALRKKETNAVAPNWRTSSCRQGRKRSTARCGPHSRNGIPA